MPLKPFLDKLEALPRSLNIGSFIGQGSVRQAVMGLANRTASAEELERMRGLVRQGMADGAFGLSTGLFYVPGAFTPLAEVVELQKIVAPYRGVHTSHMRDEAGARGGQREGDDRHRRAGRRADADLAPQDDRQGQLGQERGDAQARGRGAGARRRCDDRPVSVHRLEHVDTGRVGAAMGAGGRAQGECCSG